MENSSREWMTFDAECSLLRSTLKTCGEQVYRLKQHPATQRLVEFHSLGAKPESEQGEMNANLMLAYRHVEDAIMRLGKAIQAFDGGKSVHDS